MFNRVLSGVISTLPNARARPNANLTSSQPLPRGRGSETKLVDSIVWPSRARK